MWICGVKRDVMEEDGATQGIHGRRWLSRDLRGASECETHIYFEQYLYQV